MNAELRSVRQLGSLARDPDRVCVVFSTSPSCRQQGVFRVVTLSLAREHEIRTTIEGSGVEERGGGGGGAEGGGAEGGGGSSFLTAEGDDGSPAGQCETRS